MALIWDWQPEMQQENLPQISLSGALEQAQWFVENKTLVPKKQSIIFSNGVLIFYVNRRFKNINIAQAQQPYNFSALPMTISGLEKVNDTPVNFDMDMEIRGEIYQLRSVVCVESSSEHDGLITGTSTVIRKFGNPAFNDTFSEMYLKYDPSIAGMNMPVNNEFVKQPIISSIELLMHPVENPEGDTFTTAAQRRGTLFIYVKQTAREPDIPFGTII